MKILKKEKRTKEIILLIVLVILFNFVVPNYAQADFGGTLFNPFAQLISGIGDAVIDWLEKIFVNKEDGLLNRFYGDTSEYDTRVFYSPAVIFANKIPLLRINFITTEEHDNEVYTYTSKYSDYATLDAYIRIEPDIEEFKIYGYEGTNGVLLAINDATEKTGTKVEQTIRWDDCYCKEGIVEYTGNIFNGEAARGYYYFHLFIPLKKNIKLPDTSKKVSETSAEYIEVSEISAGYTKECWTTVTTEEKKQDISLITQGITYYDGLIRAC